MGEESRDDKVRHWRARAAQYRTLALKARSRQSRDAYQDLARNCEDVAERLEHSPERR